MRTKKRSLVLLLIGCVGVGIGSVSISSVVGCSAIAKKIIEKPKVALERVHVRDVGSAGATVVFGVQVENPNRFSIKVDALRYDVEIDGKVVSSGSLDAPAEVPAKQTSIVDIPVPIQYGDLFSSVLGFIQNGASAYRIKGAAAFGMLEVPFEKSGELNFRK